MDLFRDITVHVITLPNRPATKINKYTIVTGTSTINESRSWASAAAAAMRTVMLRVIISNIADLPAAKSASVPAAMAEALSAVFSCANRCSLILPTVVVALVNGSSSASLISMPSVRLANTSDKWLSDVGGLYSGCRIDDCKDADVVDVDGDDDDDKW